MSHVTAAALSPAAPANSPKAPLGLLSLPDELLLALFAQLVTPQDYWALKRVCRRLRAVSLTPQACHVPAWVPHYLASNPAYNQLLTWQLVRLARRVEASLCSANRPSVAFEQSGIPKPDSIEYETPVPIPRALIGDYLALGIGAACVEVVDLRTQERRVFQPHGATPTTFCAGLQGASPLLVTFSSDAGGGFKIWDLDKVMSSMEEPEPLVHDATKPFQCSNIFEGHLYRSIRSQPHFPVTRVYGSWLAVGYADHVLILDGRQLSQPGVSLPFAAAQQIEFSGTHLMLISESGYAVWELATVRGQKLTKVTELTDRGNIRFARLFGELVVMRNIQEKPRGVVGEVRNWRTNSLCKQLGFSFNQYGDAFFNSLDLDGTSSLIGVSADMACKWKLDTERSEPMSWQVFHDDSHLNRVYALGHYTLNPTHKGVSILERRYLRNWGERNRILEWANEPTPGSFIACDLLGRYLVTEVKDREMRAVTLYDLAPPELVAAAAAAATVQMQD